MDKAGLVMPRPGHPSRLLPRLHPGPRDLSSLDTGGVFTALDPGAALVLPPVCLRVLAVPPESSLRASSTLQGCMRYILESQAGPPGKLTRGGTNELGLYPGCLWKPSPRKGSGGEQDSAEVVQRSPGPGQPRSAWQRALEL